MTLLYGHRAIVFMQKTPGKIVYIPASFQAFSFDATISGLFIFEHILAQVSQDDQVFSGISLTYPALVFSIRHI
jgi:hypothetical protein